MQNRIFYLDKLRVLAIFSVIVIHVSATMWYSTPVKSFDWQMMNIYDSLVRFCVPLFIMISGAMLLDPKKDYSLKKLSSKILRIITAFAVWSALYATYHYFYDNASLKTSIKSFIEGEYHMWFVFMIIGLYIATPIIRLIAKDKKTTQYFIVLGLVINTLAAVLPEIPYGGTIFSNILADARLNLFMSYSHYYLLGYYLKNENFSKKTQKLIYFIAVLSILGTILLTSYISITMNNQIAFFYGYLLPNTAIVAIAIFIYAKQNWNKNINPIINKLSTISFGIYLVHALVLFVFNNLGFTSTLFNPLISIPLISLLCFIISATVILLIRGFGKYAKYIT